MMCGMVIRRDASSPRAAISVRMALPSPLLGLQKLLQVRGKSYVNGALGFGLKTTKAY